jgi:hypothetical protein
MFAAGSEQKSAEILTTIRRMVRPDRERCIVLAFYPLFGDAWPRD